MSDIRRKFEELMAAASFAEAGEFETAKQIASGGKKILLVLTGRVSEAKSVKYALNTAQRTDSDIEVLVTSSAGDVGRMLEEMAREAHGMGVGIWVEKKEGCIKKAIVEHTKKRRDIQFVVVESNAALDFKCTGEDRRLEGVLKSLKCPLVMVSDMETA